MALGFGPQFTFPTATETRTGTGKWQAGLAGVAVLPRPKELVGVLLTWQHSFAGSGDRRTQNNLAFQPLFLYNLPNSFYLRSTASWSFDLEQSQYAIPVDAGAGKVWIVHGGTSINLFAEPQWTVAHEDSGLP